MRALIGLGSNLGDSSATVLAALAELAKLARCRLLISSSLYRTAPITGTPGSHLPQAAGTVPPFAGAPQPDFINAVAEIETDLTPAQLIAALLELEAKHGRTRSVADAPRTLDLDLLLYGELTIAQPGLTVPHPRMHLRAFVLRPLVEIAPDCEIPGHGKAADCLSRVAGQRVEVCAC